MPRRSSSTGTERFIVDDSNENWKVPRYLSDWCQLRHPPPSSSFSARVPVGPVAVFEHPPNHQPLADHLAIFDDAAFVHVVADASAVHALCRSPSPPCRAESL